MLPETIVRLGQVLESLIVKGKISKDSSLSFVNDGSRDKTWQIIKEHHLSNSFVKGLNLAGNVGHQNALMAGLMEVKDRADMVVSIDADLQDEVSVIEEMVDRYHEGFDIVYGVRNDRKTDSFFKKILPLLFIS